MLLCFKNELFLKLFKAICSLHLLAEYSVGYILATVSSSILVVNCFFSVIGNSKQRNYCISLLRKSKREYYSSLHVNNVTDNKTLWKTVKPFLSDKVTSTQRITLIDNDKILKNIGNTAILS